MRPPGLCTQGVHCELPPQGPEASPSLRCMLVGTLERPSGSLERISGLVASETWQHKACAALIVATAHWHEDVVAAADGDSHVSPVELVGHKDDVRR